jgi:hypothetical protein
MMEESNKMIVDSDIRLANAIGELRDLVVRRSLALFMFILITKSSGICKEGAAVGPIRRIPQSGGSC